MKKYTMPTNVLKKYSSLFSTGIHACKKHHALKFSYFLISKKTHFICLEGMLARNSRKHFSIYQTYSITTSLKKQGVEFNIPVHSNAVLVL